MFYIWMLLCLSLTISVFGQYQEFDALKKVLYPDFQSPRGRLKFRKTVVQNITRPRRLATTNDTISLPDNTTVCVACKNLQYCNILNNYMVQEVYYPKNPEFLGTCAVIEALGERLSGEIFGVGRTFRDTSECRNIVMQYLCLFWGSNNTMYYNGCSALDEINRPFKDKQIYTQTPPCRSFCVQVAEACANNFVDFLDICWEITCPPTETYCTPDPNIGTQVVSAGIGCSMPYYDNPYANSGYKYSPRVFVSIVVTMMFSALCIFVSN